MTEAHELRRLVAVRSPVALGNPRPDLHRNAHREGFDPLPTGEAGVAELLGGLVLTHGVGPQAVRARRLAFWRSRCTATFAGCLNLQVRTRRAMQARHGCPRVYSWPYLQTQGLSSLTNVRLRSRYGPCRMSGTPRQRRARSTTGRDRRAPRPCAARAACIRSTTSLPFDW